MCKLYKSPLRTCKQEWHPPEHSHIGLWGSAGSRIAEGHFRHPAICRTTCALNHVVRRLNTSTMATARRGGKVAPSIIRSETFLFALVVLSLGVIVPYYTRPSGSVHSAYQNGTAVPVAVVPPASEPSPIIIQPHAPLQPQQPVQQPPPVQYAVPSAPNSPAAALPSPAAPAPITYILPLLKSATKAFFRFFTHVPVYTYFFVQTTVIRPLRYPLAIIWSILRPLTLLLEILFILFIRTPYSVVSWFVTEAIYPL